MKNLGKGYFLRDDGLLFRPNLKREHLLWKYGGVPSFNAKIYDDNHHKITWVGASTNYQKFRMRRDTFDFYRKTVNLTDKQYYVPMEHWVEEKGIF